jgi:hypothetical protein
LCFVITTQCLCWPLFSKKKKKVKTKPFLFVLSIPFGWMIVKSKLVKHFISDRDTKKLQQQHTSNIVYAIIWKIQTKFLKFFLPTKKNKLTRQKKSINSLQKHLEPTSREYFGLNIWFVMWIVNVKVWGFLSLFVLYKL